MLEAGAQTEVGNAAFHFFRQGDGLVRAVFLSPDRNNRRTAESCGIGDLLLLEYATSSTDTVHKGGDASFAAGHPEKVVDFAYRAVHEMTVKSKTIMMAFYGRGPRLSYWNGCSTDGRQGLMEATRYPEDFDGVIAGAPANNQLQLGAWPTNLDTTIRKDLRSIVPRAKILIVNRSVMAACDELDGVKDGLLSDPMKCHFDPSTAGMTAEPAARSHR